MVTGAQVSHSETTVQRLLELTDFDRSFSPNNQKVVDVDRYNEFELTMYENGVVRFESSEALGFESLAQSLISLTGGLF